MLRHKPQSDSYDQPPQIAGLFFGAGLGVDRQFLARIAKLPPVLSALIAQPSQPFHLLEFRQKNAAGPLLKAARSQFGREPTMTEPSKVALKQNEQIVQSGCWPESSYSCGFK